MQAYIDVASRVRATGLVGRDGELTVLHDRLLTALAGDGHLVLISGQAGIGKTTLATAIEREADEYGALVLTGRCYDLTDTPHYGPWLEIVRDYPARSVDLPPLPAGLAQPNSDVANEGAESLAAELRHFLAAVARRRPLVLILEDLHWADPASLDLLRRLSRDADRLPLLLVVTYRADDVAREHPLYATLPVLVREAVATRLELRPLDDSDVWTLVDARYSLSERDLSRLVVYLQARAEGNPFFLAELPRTLEDERILQPATAKPELTGAAGWELGDVNQVGLPLLLRQVLERRLARIADHDRRLLVVAAMIGHEVPLALWATLGGADEETLLEVVDRGVEARVLEAPAESAGVRFAHALIREVLYESMLPPRRRVWHRRVAEALLAESRPDPEAVAFHFRQAGDARAREWLILAGERAQRAQAWLTAADRYDAALAIHPSPITHHPASAHSTAPTGAGPRLGASMDVGPERRPYRERCLRCPPTASTLAGWGPVPQPRRPFVSSREENTPMMVDQLTRAWIDVRSFDSLARKRDGTDDWWQPLQQAIDYLIADPFPGETGTLYLPPGIYRISRPLQIRVKYQGGYGFCSIHIVGDSPGYGAGGFHSSAIVTDFGDGPAIVIQSGRAVKLENLTIRGQNGWQFHVDANNKPDRDPGDMATHYDDASYLLPGVRDNRYSPHAGIAIDPYHADVARAERYPSLAAEYTNTGTGGGSSALTFQNCFIYNVTVGVGISLNGHTANAENINLVDCTFGSVKSAIAVGQDQSRNVTCQNVSVYGPRAAPAPPICIIHAW